jgi:nicotinamide-nucleotide amidase
MPLRVEILNTGSELLLGQVTNTHLASIAQALFPLGLRVQFQTCVDDGEPIRPALQAAFSRCDVLIVTGGLGPTSDDVTRDVTAELLDLPLRHDPVVMQAIEERFARRGLTVTGRIQRQAQVPAGAEVLPNPNGTAPGLYVKTDQSPFLFLLPGPPRELLPMLHNEVIPRLHTLLTDATPHECKVYRLAGIGESQVEDLVGAQLEAINGLELGYCARAGEVDLRIIGTPAVLEFADRIVQKALGDRIFSADGSNLESVVVNLLRDRNCTLALAESCTGGFLAHRVTNVPGASSVLDCGLVTYSNESKTRLLQVSETLLAEHGAVSGQVARAMVEGLLHTTPCDFAISVTGVAGPGGGTEEKPVGTVYIGLGRRGKEARVARHQFVTDRETFKAMTTQTALEMLRQDLLKG